MSIGKVSPPPLFFLPFIFSALVCVKFSLFCKQINGLLAIFGCSRDLAAGWSKWRVGELKHIYIDVSQNQKKKSNPFLSFLPFPNLLFLHPPNSFSGHVILSQQFFFSGAKKEIRKSYSKKEKKTRRHIYDICKFFTPPLHNFGFLPYPPL